MYGIMISKAVLIAALIAYVEARFGQEQVPIPAITAVKGGASGAAATIGGAAISDLLGAANSCAKLQRADQIVAQLGGGADAIAAAIGMVTAEKNTNPFANNNTQNVCGDPTLPATAELRGITPLIDPAVDVTGGVAALSSSSSKAPLNAAGMSVFDLIKAAGFGDLVVSQVAGANAAAAAAANNAGGNNQQAAAGNGNQQAATGMGNQQAAGNGNQQAAAGNGNQQAAAGNGNQQAAAGKGNQQAAAGNGNNQQAANNQQAGGANQNANAGNGAACNSGIANNGTQSGNQNAGNANQNQNAGNANLGAANNGAGAAAGGAAAGGADFGKCTPTMIFEAGQNGRAATEFTFQIADPVARGGQQDALNPNIITNALCNQLTNVCGANAAAIATCLDAKAKVQAAGTRDKSTADLFNTAIGFAGAVTNPDGGPADRPAATATAAGNANRKMKRGLRL
ncbi:uncharacterized protein M421DRAFT_172439 [Didymella exigua CBS 183.55]|uniref:Circumsporozoite protein n=1 Tax=Didymella exigua CBS 183.55 TaxID=1150837 RepID=A0A6A5RKM9_9PLEO|nr:uncharacterized protein M421DRAFT_172439 [Didymella exigua CBS 183.55]KAF1927668.1 hypothetical protein M421DRAFT_172439 [Didymella exigua CBS 183.55]